MRRSCIAVFFLVVAAAAAAWADFFPHFWGASRNTQRKTSTDDMEVTTPPSASVTPNELFDYFRRHTGIGGARFSSLARIPESKGWMLQVDVPGLHPDEITITANGPILNVHGEHSCPDRKDPTCIERYVSEEIRFPEAADLDTAEADLGNGVLQVRVKPVAGANTRGRVVKIIDRARGTASTWSNLFKSPFNWQAAEEGKEAAATADAVKGDYPTMEYVQDAAGKVKHLAEMYGSQVDDIIRDYASEVALSLSVPEARRKEFTYQVRAQSEALYRQLRDNTISPHDAYEKTRDNAERVWATLNGTLEGVQDQLSNQSEKIASGASGLAHGVAQGIKNVAGEVGGTAQVTFEYVTDEAKRKARDVADAVYEAAQNAKDEAQRRTEQAAETLKRGAEAVGEAARDKVEAARDTVEAARDKVGQAAEAAGSMKDEALHRVTMAAGDVVHRVKSQYDEASYTQKSAAQEASFTAEAHAPDAGNFAESLKKKLGF